MCLIQNDQIIAEGFSFVHYIIELVSQNFRCADYDWSFRVILCIPCENSHITAPEAFPEFHPFGIGQSFQR